MNSQDELGWESLSDRRWGRRMTMYYKIVNGHTPAYLFDHVPNEAPRVLRKFIPKAPITKTQRYANSFFPYCINQWETLDGDIKHSTSIQNFKNNINEQIRPNSSFCCNRNKYGMKLLTQIRVDFSDLRDHRFDHKFNCPSPLCSCGIEDETSSHFLLSCPRYKSLRQTYLSKISEITNSDITILPNDHLTDLLLYGSKAYNDITNELILTETILYIYKSERFKHLEAFSWLLNSTIPSAWAPYAKPCELHLATLIFCNHTVYFFLSCECVMGPGGFQQEACTRHTTY